MMPSISYEAIKDVAKKYIWGFMSMLLAMSYIVIELTDWSFFKYIVGMFILFFIAVSLPKLRGTILIITTVLIIMTILLLVGSNRPFAVVLEGARVNLTLVTIFILTPILGITVRTGGYIESLKVFLGKLKNNVVFFYISTYLLTHSLGVVLNVGSVLINHYLTSVSTIKSPRIISNALNRGFTTSIYWSPYFSAMALMVSHLGVSWGGIVIYALGFTVISFLIGFMLEFSLIQKEKNRLFDREKKEFLTESTATFKNEGRHLIELVVLLLMMMGLVLFIERLPSISMVLAICIVSILYPFIWCLLKGNSKGYKKELKSHITETLPKLRQEITLFLTAGLFSAVFVASRWSTIMVEHVNDMFGHSSIVITIVLSLTIVVTGILGLHPIILITILVTTFDPIQIGLSKEYYALMLLASWGISNTVSPATAVSNILANTLKQPVLDVSLKWNWKYALVMIIILPVYLVVLKI